MKKLSTYQCSALQGHFFYALLFLLLTHSFSAQVLINADVKINGFRHNKDCGNDAGGFNSQPDPRYKVWIGYNAGNFTQITNGPGLFTGCAGTYGADAVFCSTWNPGLINALTISAQPLTQLNVDMESWEEDGCGSNCDGNSCTFNSDDTRCGRLRIGDINFYTLPPCQSNVYTGQYTSGNFLSMQNRCSDNNGEGYGIDKLLVNWSFASAPTILTDASPYDRVLCLGTSTTLAVTVNSWNGWSLGQLVQWQVSTNTDCNIPGTWTDIPGATSLTYTPPQTPGTRLYRCVISSSCTDINTQQVISQCVRVTYQPFAAPIISNACAAVTVPNVPIQFCTTLPPNADASVAAGGYTWSVSPSAGVTITSPTTSCTDITFTNSGSYTISVAYTDACPSADAVSTCNTTVSPPSCDMIYVDAATGNNSNLGFPSAPVANLWKAMQLVGGGRTNIRITGGTYTEPNIINLQSDVLIDGSWQNNAGVWTKTSAQNTILNFSGEETLSASVTHKVGIKATNVNGWALQDLQINTNNCTGSATDGRGKSNYGVLISGCSNYAVTRCAINAGTGTNGSNGTNGANGSAGGTGGTGLDGHCDNNTTNRVGGAGAAAVGTGTRRGGAGGTGGMGADHNSNNATAGSAGAAGGGGATGGSGAGSTGSSGGCTNTSNKDGRKGQDGTAGSLGANASSSADITNTTFLSYWTPNGNATNGADGTGGGGAQGGGGGGRQDGFFCDDGGGSGGGGGGSGGQGGAGGTGGMGGGGSFGIYRYNSNTGAQIQDITVVVPGIVPSGGSPGTGGTGGAGGSGGCGGGGNNTSTTSGGSLGNNGGLCSTSRVCGSTEVGAGGQGGRGGNGGNGGTGQPGASGMVAYMVTDGTLSNPSTSIPNPTTITLEFPRNGKGCVNSEVNLTNVTPSAWTLTGSTLLDNVNLGVSNYTLASNPVQVYYTSTGVYDVGASGATYQDWIHIIDGTRPANATFNSGSSTACSGSTVSLNAAPWGTELAWEWVLFSTDATVPIQTQTTQTATFTMPTVTTTTVFNIRYRVEESCCGWSKPYYTTITVYPVTTPDVASSGGNAFCTGQSLTLSATGGGSYLWSEGSTTSSITVNTPGNYSVTVTDPNGCASTSTPFAVSVNPLPTPTISAAGSSVICPPADVTLQSSTAAGQTYTWNTGATTSSITTATPGSYSVSVIDANGCAGASAPFTVYDMTANIFVDGSSTICQGGSVQVSVNAPYLDPATTFQWSLNGQAIAGATSASYAATQTGSYQVILTNGSCTQTSASVQITVFTATLTSTNSATTLCPGTSLTLTASTGTSYQWQLNGTDITGATNQTYDATQGGSYTVVISDGTCNATSSAFTITEIIPTVTSSTGTNTLCPGSSLVLTASSGSNYQWQLNGTNISGATSQTYTVTQAGSYTVTALDPTGTCTSISTAFVITEIIPTVTSTGGSTTLCPGSSLTLTSSAGTSYQWQLNGANITGATNQTYDATQAGSYTVVVTDLAGTCTSTSTAFTITEIIPTVTGAGGSGTLCPGATLVLTSSAGTSYQWQLNGTNIAGETNQTYSATQSGSYTVVVLDNNGTCTSTSTAFTVIDFTSTITSVGGATTLCPGSSLVLTAPTSTTYQWQLNGTDISGETSQTYTATQGGSYTVVVTSGACSGASSPFLITEIVPTVTSSNGTNNLCPGSSLTLTSSVGTSYQWQLNGTNITGETNQTLTVTQGGNYTVVVLDPTGTCTSTSLAFVITEIVPTVTSTGGTTALCPGTTITLTSSIGTSYQWQLNGVNIAGATNQTYDASQAGSYTVVVLDAAGTCTSTSVAFVITDNIPTVTSTGGTTTLCPGSSVLLTSSVGTSYQWLLNGANIAGATNQTYTATQGGSYTVVVLDASGTCTSTSVAFVITEIVPTITSTGGTSTLCPGSSLTLTSSVGTSYQWQLNGTNIAGATNQTYSATQGGSYTVVVVDPTGACTSTSVAFVITEIVPTISTTVGTTTLCPGSTLTLTSSIGNSYQWQLNGTNIAGATNQTYDATQAGSYSVTVLDTAGTCTSTSVAFVVTEIIPTVTSTGGATTLCPGGSLLLTSSAGTSYQWQLNGANIAGATSQTYSATQAGNYTVVVLDPTGTCTSTSAVFTLTDLTATITSAGGATTVCPGSSLTLTSAVGTSYQWQLNGTNIAGATNQTYAATQAGTYTVIVTSNSCSLTSAAFTVTEITPTVSTTGNTTTLCPGSSLTLTSSVGTSYQWQLNGTNIAGATNQTYSATQAGSYTVTVLDPTGFCTSTSLAFVVTEIVPTVTSTGGATTLCPGSSLTLTSSAGTSYQWLLNGTNIAGATSQTYSATQAGSYTVTVLDAAGTCSSTSVAFVITEIIPTVTSAGGATTLCPGSSLTLTASAGTAFQWQLNGTNIAGATSQTYAATLAGSYTVTVTNGTCTSTSNAFTITNLTSSITSTGGATTLCPGSSLTLTASAGTSYQWQLNGTNIAGATSQTYSATQTGSYVVIVTSGTCSLTSSAFTITTIVPTVTSTGGATTLCPGSSLTLTSSAGNSYQWQLNGTNIAGATSQTFAATQAGTYTVVVTSGTCTSTSSAYAITAIVPTITSTGNVHVICQGSSLVLTASVGTAYQWLLNGTNIAGATSQTFTATQTGNYTVSVTSGTCTSTSVAYAISVVSATVTSTGGATALCPGSSLTLTSSTGTGYQWQLNGVNIPGATAQTYTATQAGSYTVIVSAPSCTSTSTAFVITTITPTVTSTGGSTTICQGSSLTLTASTGTAYQWQLNGANIPGATSQTFAATQAGSYTVTVTAGACTSTSSAFALTLSTSTVPTISVSVDGGCAPLNVVFTSSQAVNQALWSVNGTNLPSGISNYSFLNAGCNNIGLTGVLSDGCSFNAVANSAVCIDPLPNSYFSTNPSAFNEDNQNVIFNNGSTNAVSYIWDFGNGNTSTQATPSFTFTQNRGGHTVTLTAVSALGCIDVYSIFIPFSDNSDIFYVPNTFTPDDDEHNQTFQPVFTSGFDPYSFEMTIYNRWGETVWVSKDAAQGWDGTYGLNGRKVQDGVYVWKITYKSKETDKKRTVTGNVNLLR